jgi:hypothetical protein
MAGKGGKGLLAAKTTAAKTAEKDKGKKAPVSRSSRAGLQVSSPVLLPCVLWCFKFRFWVSSRGRLLLRPPPPPYEVYVLSLLPRASFCNSYGQPRGFTLVLRV